MAAIVGFVEGMVLVATPALVRDFSPQLGRGRAMGIWTMGPVLGSLVVSEVASNTLPHLHAWQDQYHIAGLAGLGVFVIAFFGLRELSPSLRDQLMFSIRERSLVEARAKGIDVEAALHRPWRQMFTPNVVVPAVGVSLFLLIYYAAVGFFVIYFTSVFGFSQSQANGLGNWFWAADAITVVVVGIISDRVGVRKPFIVAGTIVAIVHDTRVREPGHPPGHELRQLHRAHLVPFGQPRLRLRAVDGGVHRDAREEEPGPRRDRARDLGLGPARPSWRSPS